MYSLKQTHSTSWSLSSSSRLIQQKPALPLQKPYLLSSPKIQASLSQSFPISPNSSSPILSDATAKVQPRSAANAAPLTPINFLERAAVVYGDCPAILYNDTAQSWSETNTRCLKLASSIVSLGIRRGDIVSVVAPNVPAMCELNFAVPMAGAVLNNINFRLDANAISNLLQHSGSKLVFVDIQSVTLIHEAISLFPPQFRRPVFVLIGDEDYEKSLIDSSIEVNGDVLDYENLVENGDPEFKWINPDSEWDPITLNYTSGTTSSPKGVMHSHRGAFLMSMDSLLDWSVPRRPVYLWTLPIFHANGWSYAWGTAAVGGTNVSLRRVDAPSIYGAIEKYRVTHMCGAPVVLNMLANHPCRKPLESSIHVMTAGAPPPAAVLNQAESLGFKVSHGYGLTETGGLVVTCAWKEEWNRFSDLERARLKSRQGVRTIGFAAADVVDPDSGESVARDGCEIGEIVLRGGSMMLGYLKDPEGTAKCLKEDGWFYTGDVGVMHPDGYLEVKDRSKDVIICGGENVSSVEVEAVLYGHPAVNEAAVVARPDRYWGETPCAFVSLKEEAAERPTEKEIREFCKAKLPLYMVPRTVVFRDELPKTSTGKIQKFILRDLAKQFTRVENSTY